MLCKGLTVKNKPCRNRVKGQNQYCRYHISRPPAVYSPNNPGESVRSSLPTPPREIIQAPVPTPPREIIQAPAPTPPREIIQAPVQNPSRERGKIPESAIAKFEYLSGARVPKVEKDRKFEEEENKVEEKEEEKFEEEENKVEEKEEKKFEKDRKFEEKECAVCIESFEEEFNPLNPCGHYIHEECVYKTGTNLCPICRCEVIFSEKSMAEFAKYKKQREDEIEAKNFRAAQEYKNNEEFESNIFVLREDACNCSRCRNIYRRSLNNPLVNRFITKLFSYRVDRITWAELPIVLPYSGGSIVRDNRVRVRRFLNKSESINLMNCLFQGKVVGIDLLAARRERF